MSNKNICFYVYNSQKLSSNRLARRHIKLSAAKNEIGNLTETSLRCW